MIHIAAWPCPLVSLLPFAATGLQWQLSGHDQAAWGMLTALHRAQHSTAGSGAVRPDSMLRAMCITHLCGQTFSKVKYIRCHSRPIGTHEHLQ